MSSSHAYARATLRIVLSGRVRATATTTQAQAAVCLLYKRYVRAPVSSPSVCVFVFWPETYIYHVCLHMRISHYSHVRCSRAHTHTHMDAYVCVRVSARVERNVLYRSAIGQIGRCARVQCHRTHYMSLYTLANRPVADGWREKGGGVGQGTHTDTCMCSSDRDAHSARFTRKMRVSRRHAHISVPDDGDDGARRLRRRRRCVLLWKWTENMPPPQRTTRFAHDYTCVRASPSKFGAHIDFYGLCSECVRVPDQSCQHKI